MKGQKLYKKAKKIIPGGTQLLSKRSEMFLPDYWPSYYDKAKGVCVWTLDGEKLIDMTMMGVGACVLGYSDDDVNNKVKEAVEKGSMCTLNSPEEVELAEFMLKLQPWAGKVRFARTGGESMAVAVRIARAFTRKDKIAFCGYHGWSDWYLSANVKNSSNLDEHLLSGLEPKGVPKNLEGTAVPFRYNDINALRKIAQKNELAAIVIEPIRYVEPNKDFFKEIMEIAKEKNAVLVIDEITSGFRINIGGAYQNYGLKPDIVVFGKAIANGYPMGIIIGKNKVMDASQSSFISSTFWTERIGPVAALATLKKIVNNDVPSHLIKIGKYIKKGWFECARKNNIKIEIMGIDPLATFHFNYGDKSQLIHTYFTQEMLKLGYLASKQVYVSYAHNEDIINNYINAVDIIFKKISVEISEGSIENKLKGPIAHSGFQRLN